MRGQVTIHVDADIDAVWTLVSDVTRIGQFSPETFEARWVTSPPCPSAGARFRGHVRRNGRGPVYWTDCRVLECDPPTVFSFGVYVRDRLVPDSSGTQVTESFELPDRPLTRWYWRIAGAARGRTNDRGMRQTLERVKAVAEAERLS